MRSLIIHFMFLTSLTQAQFSDFEIAMGHRRIDFGVFPLGDYLVEGKGVVEFMVIVNGDSTLERIDLVRNDFNKDLENLCLDFIRSLKFIPPEFVGPEEKYYEIFTFRYKKKFKHITMSSPKIFKERSTKEN